MDLSAVSRVLIAHNPAGEGDDPSTADVLAQVGLVTAGLEALGIPCQSLAIPDWKPWLHLSPDPGTVVFNLMEAPPGVPHVHPDAAAALELMGVPFTGSSAATLTLTTDKLATRALPASEGLPVAPCGRLDPDCPGQLHRVPGPWIVKPAREDASLGLEGDPVHAIREAVLVRAWNLAARFPGQSLVVETFLPGRELNVSLLAGKVLPVAEIVFDGFPEGMSRVVGYEAKWQEDSFEYVHTVRHFPEGDEDADLLERVRSLARKAWRVCALRGYARIDLRLDHNGEPHILEVNANPCLAPDAGFMAAARQAGLTAGEVVQRILSEV